MIESEGLLDEMASRGTRALERIDREGRECPARKFEEELDERRCPRLADAFTRLSERAVDAFCFCFDVDLVELGYGLGIAKSISLDDLSDLAELVIEFSRCLLQEGSSPW